MIKLVAIDVDGTLLNSNNYLSEGTIKIIQEYISKGIKIVICTGRPSQGVYDIINQIGIQNKDDYLISFNGSVIETVSDKKVIKREKFSYSEFCLIEELAKKLKLGLHIQSDKGIYTTDQPINNFTHFDAKLNRSILHQVTSIEIKKININKIVLVGEPVDLDLIVNEIPENYFNSFQIVRSLECFLEFLPITSGKGNALRFLSNYLGIKSTEIVAIGDNDNDISMFNFAGISVAMENGSSNAKKHANHVTLSNDAEGVLNALTKLRGRL